MKNRNTSSGIVEKMMKEMFARLLNIEVNQSVIEKLVPVTTSGKSAPPKARGRAIKMVIGCRK